MQCRPSGTRTDNLAPLGEAANTARLHLEAAGTSSPNPQASVAVNLLGLLDLVQISAEGLAPKSRYNVYLADSNRGFYGNPRALAVLKTNPYGAGIVQAVAPLKTLASNGESASAGSSRRFLIITENE